MAFIDSLKELDTQLFLFFNGRHNSFFDPIMFWCSHRLFWIPLYLFFFYLVIKHTGRQFWLVVLAAILLIVLSDQISVHAFKNVFMRYRPCHNLLIQAQVYVNDGCGGQYGFISSHAANTFALAMFLSLLFRSKWKYFTVLVFAWAVFVCYSRIYNGVHYPGDLVVGGIVGMGIGIVVFKIYEFFQKKIDLKKAHE
ncbi:MAG: phosphatase PAP2 family protein [Bacteroidota bacterium]|nr:phosphatase PAP2 family protein [Bacteroidota bacterium]